MKNFYHRAWAEINLDVLKNNIEIIREYSGNRDIIAIVKANAYGHGEPHRRKALRGIQSVGGSESFLGRGRGRYTAFRLLRYSADFRKS